MTTQMKGNTNLNACCTCVCDERTAPLQLVCDAPVQHAAVHVCPAEAAWLLQVHHHEVLLHVATQDVTQP